MTTLDTTIFKNIKQTVLLLLALYTVLCVNVVNDYANTCPCSQRPRGHGVCVVNDVKSTTNGFTRFYNVHLQFF